MKDGVSILWVDGFLCWRTRLGEHTCYRSMISHCQRRRWFEGEKRGGVEDLKSSSEMRLVVAALRYECEHVLLLVVSAVWPMRIV